MLAVIDRPDIYLGLPPGISATAQKQKVEGVAYANEVTQQFIDSYHQYLPQFRTRSQSRARLQNEYGRREVSCLRILTASFSFVEGQGLSFALKLISCFSGILTHKVTQGRCRLVFTGEPSSWGLSGGDQNPLFM